MADFTGNAEELMGLIERIENVEDEIKGLSEDRKDIYAEAKARGYHTKFIRAIVALRALDPEKRSENDQLLALYRQAAGIA